MLKHLILGLTAPVVLFANGIPCAKHLVNARDEATIASTLPRVGRVLNSDHGLLLITGGAYFAADYTGKVTRAVSNHWDWQWLHPRDLSIQPNYGYGYDNAGQFRAAPEYELVFDLTRSRVNAAHRPLVNSVFRIAAPDGDPVLVLENFTITNASHNPRDPFSERSIALTRYQHIDPNGHLVEPPALVRQDAVKFFHVLDGSRRVIHRGTTMTLTPEETVEHLISDARTSGDKLAVETHDSQIQLLKRFVVRSKLDAAQVKRLVEDLLVEARSLAEQFQPRYGDTILLNPNGILLRDRWGRVEFDLEGWLRNRK